MSRKKGTRDSSSPKNHAEALPTTRQTSEAVAEQSIRTDNPDHFFSDGTIKTFPGACNVLIVAPNMSPDSDDKNVGLLTYWLTETLGAYAVVNCGRYRRPVDGDPTPEELQVSYSPKPHKKEKGILELRQRLVEETGGIPANLDSFNSASIAAYEYAEPIWLDACAIAYKSIPLAFFVCGIDDGRADELELDVAVGAGYLLRDKEQVCERDTGSAGGAFVEELIGRLSRLRDGIRVRDGVEGYSLTGDKIAGWLRSTWTDDRDDLYEPDMAEGWIADDIHSVQLAIRYTGFRDSKDNLRRTVQELAGAISGLSSFTIWEEEEMAKPEEKKAKKAKSEKEKPSKEEKAPAVDEQPPGGAEGDAKSKELAESVQKGVTLISHQKFQEKVNALKGLTTIRNDSDEDVAFEGEAKELFISAFESAYPVIERALGSINELGTFLLGVRKELKPRKLYYAWLDYAGIPKRTAANYVQVYERYADSLPKFGYLGVKKLLAASRLKECVDYVERNEQVIAEQSAAELERAVKALRSAKKTSGTGRGRKPTYIPVGKCRIRPSSDGTKLVIECLTEKKQAQLIEAIKGLLS